MSKNRRGGRKAAGDAVSERELSAALPKGQGLSVADLRDDQRASLERMVQVRRPKRGRREITLARAKTDTVVVAHPTLTGNEDEAKTQVVERVSDALTQMFNRGNITQLQFSAGDRYRDAFEMTSASPGGSMDFDRARGSGGGTPLSPPISYLFAAETVSEAKRILYPRDFAVVHRVCVLGMGLESVARELSELSLNIEMDRKEAASRLRAALDVLADKWWPNSAPTVIETVDPKTGEKTTEEVRKITKMRTEKHVVGAIGAIDAASKVAHATRDKLYYTERERSRDDKNKRGK